MCMPISLFQLKFVEFSLENPMASPIDILFNDNVISFTFLF